MARPDQIYLLRRTAYERIVAETRRSPGRETGGILVGRTYTLAGAVVLVIFAASGPHTSDARGQDRFAPDPQAHQAELVRWRAHYASDGVDYAGTWHTHPFDDGELSGGDLAQVAEILADPDYNLPDGIYTPVVTLVAGEPVLHSWYCPRETARPERVPWSVIEELPARTRR